MRLLHARARSSPSSDLESPGGTFVNQQRLLSGQPRKLSPGDVIQLGGVQLKVKQDVATVAKSLRPRAAPPPPKSAAAPPAAGTAFTRAAAQPAVAAAPRPPERPAGVPDLRVPQSASAVAVAGGRLADTVYHG